MAKLSKKKVYNNYNDSLHSKQSFSDSSVNILTDNRMLTNKKLFIHYGKEKRDFHLEIVLRRLNAEILEFFDEEVNYVITAVNRNKVMVNNRINEQQKPIINNGSMSLRARKLVGLVQQKGANVAMLSQPEKDNSGGGRDFLDIVAEKGIAIIHLQRVWKWLRKHHLLLVQENDDQNEDEIETHNDINQKVKNLIQPCIKIIDITNETRPTFHQKCLFNPQMFEECVAPSIEEKVENNVDSTQSKQNETIKSTKIIKKVNKSVGNGYCECCNVNYTSLINHLTSSRHEEFAKNEANFKEIDQVLSDLSQLPSFFAMRLKKQTILDKRKSSNKLIKSLSANDFKNEIKTQVPQKGGLLPPLECAENIDVDDKYEIISTKANIIKETLHVVHNESNVVEVTVCKALLEELIVEEEKVINLEEDSIEYNRALISIQENMLNMVTEERCVYHCAVQEEEVTLETADIVEIDYLDSIENISVNNNNVSIVKCQLHFATTFIQPILIHEEKEDNDDSEEDSNDSDSFPLNLTNMKHSFSPFFLHNLNSSPKYPQLTPKYEYPPSANINTPPHNNINDNRELSDSPTQYIPKYNDDDQILDLRQLSDSNNVEEIFNKISALTLSQKKNNFNIDNLVNHCFKNKYQIDLQSHSQSQRCLREVTNTVAVASKQLDGGDRTPQIESSYPTVYAEKLEKRPLARRAKSVARDSISLTTQLYLI